MSDTIAVKAPGGKKDTAEFPLARDTQGASDRVRPERPLPQGSRLEPSATDSRNKGINSRCGRSSVLNSRCGKVNSLNRSKDRCSLNNVISSSSAGKCSRSSVLNSRCGKAGSPNHSAGRCSRSNVFNSNSGRCNGSSVLNSRCGRNNVTNTRCSTANHINRVSSNNGKGSMAVSEVRIATAPMKSPCPEKNRTGGIRSTQGDPG